ncbi:unnamed protein product [Phaedon cochleariae]|uniref:non-specific serine/threonine protein kinase n=1 Tax=Phaedon cochleariae TaxID=80249 RepID=A0A9P0GIF4_PHACE|nr:unnamed protein product [Phaedon cochleariae]
MEPLKEPISVRVARINAEITEKTAKFDKNNLLARETLLDVLHALYEECCLENLQKYDANIARFVDKFKDSIKEIKQLRVNISDFEVKNVIGRGHFGEVHLIKEKQTGDVYAMKTIRKLETGNDSNRMSFSIERDIMAFSNSHWLTSLQYAFQDNTYLFYVMEYHSGGDLLGLLYRQGGTLPESAATFYISELILALGDLHLMGYVHRDIKPDNILLDRCGHLKLADFGSAAKLNEHGMVNVGPPVGTPDYVAPEVLQCLDNKSTKNSGYGVSCDFWSLGVLAYELTIGNTPFAGQNSTSIYSKIMNHTNTLKFPSDILLSQAYVNFVKSLVTDQKSRMSMRQIRKHELFKNTHFDTVREQVPPFVPKISSVEDTSNFSDIQTKQKTPSIESFKKRTQFSGRNLPFVGFTFTHGQSCYEGGSQRKIIVKDELVENLKSEVECLKVKLVKNEEFDKERDSLEQKLEVKNRKLESMENLRDRLERDLAGNIAECGALKRTLELERKDRAELEKKALDLIKSAKLKWEISEKNKVEALMLEIDQQKEKITQLTTTNNILNEQLQHALKMEVKHKDSLEHVQVLSRRSVIGLESRLDKVTTETQGAIADLQKRLSEECHQKTVIENKLSQAKDKEARLKQKLSQSELNFEVWKSKIDEAEGLIKQLSDQVSVLEKDVSKMEEYKVEIGCLREKVDSSNKVVKDLENRNTSLQMATKAMEEHEREMEAMRKTIAKLQSDRKVEELESQLLEEREKCLSLVKQLQDSENILTENQALKELRTKYWRMEKDLENSKIDKRILERELKEAQSEIKQLNETIEGHEKSLADTKRVGEAALVELSNINESMSLELMKLKNSCKNLQDKLDNEKEKNAGEKALLTELKEIVRSKDEQIAGQNNEISVIKKERTSMENEMRKYESDVIKLKLLVEVSQKEKREVQDELEKAKRELQNTNLNLEALREACTMLETQLIEFEKINASHENKVSSLNANTDKLIRDLCSAKQQIQEAKKSANEEKSLKLLAETKAKRLLEDIECLHNECTSYKQQCMEYKQYSTQLSDELSVAEEKISDLEVTVKAQERLISDVKSDNKVIKQELSDHLTQLNRARESSCKLKHQLSEEREEKSMLLEKIDELERDVNEKSHFYKERETKADATIKQQIKLIDYLQTKIDEQNNKKRTLTEVLFGSSKKENQPPMSLAMNYKDLETQLLKERQTNKQLHEEIYKLKAATLIPENAQTAEKSNIKVDRHKSEILSPKSRVAMQQIVNSPSKQKSDVYRQNSVQRMHHNIPHRFVQKYGVLSTTCVACSRPMSGVSRPVAACVECNVQCHVGCKKDVPNTCGLPQVFAQHYVDSLQPAKSGKTTEPLDKEEVVNVEGWIKIPGKSNNWEKHYAVLTDTSINIYTAPPADKTASPVRTFPLKPDGSHGKVVSEPLLAEIGAPVANSDLAFILKVEVAPDTTCWPPKSLIILTLSAQDKDKWFLALQKIYYDDLDKPKFEKVFTPPEDLDVTCIVDLTENIKVIGTEQGLYSYHEKTFTAIAGLSQVHQISVMSTTGTVLMIVDQKRTLISCDLSHLINLAQCTMSSKPKLKFKHVDISGLNGFHKVQVSTLAGQPKICTATAKQLIILNYDVTNGDFVPARILDTAEPTGCALFTENSLIVGADKFFEIDLATYRAEEFLDVSDAKLKQAERCYKMGSYPLAITQICKNPKEYLLCFNEFSVFVDEYGRSTRNGELKSTHLPLDFVFNRPYLYVIQFAAIEILKISEETCNSSVNEATNGLDFVRLELEKFRYVGGNKQGIYVVLEGDVKFVSANKILDMDSSSIVSDSTENGSDRFSFTSSMVQSLDGHLSDSESVEDKQRRVRFSQTDL